MSNHFEICKEILLPASPEQVWHAVATADGQAGWSPDPYAAEQGHSVEETPPSRLVVRTPTEPNGAFHEFEYLIESRDDGTTLKFTHSGFLGEDWEADFDYAELTGYGWDMYLHTLQQYMTHFPGRSAIFVTGQAPEHAHTHEAWVTLERALGLPDGSTSLKVGDPVRLTPEGLPVLEGVIDYVEPGEDFLAIRSSDGLYRFHSLELMGMPIAIGHYIYSVNDDADASADREAIEQAWDTWLENTFR